MIEVVSAVIIRRGRILLTQRRESQDYPFMWESPGGKVEPGEPPIMALLRELVEEIGYASGVGVVPEPIADVRFEGKALPACRIQFFAVVDVETVYAREGQGLGWFTTGEMVTLPLVPGNRLALAKIVERVRASRG